MTLRGRSNRLLGVLRQGDFRRLWAADALSQLGTASSQLVVPLLALNVLHASAFEVSLLRTLQSIAYLLLGLQAGAWCDRLRSRPVLVTADLGRAAAFGSVPLAAACGVLTIWQLYATVLVVGVLTVFFDVARRSYLPKLLARADLIEGNAKLQGNRSVAAVAAPSVGGGLVQWCTAPVATLLDALSYLWSAAWLRSIRTEEPRPAPRPRALRREIGDGLRLVRAHPVLRAIGGYGATMAFFQSQHLAISVVFLATDLRLSPIGIGLLSSVGLVGAVLGALLARRLAAKFGAARSLLGAALVFGGCYLLYPLTGPGWALLPWAIASFVCSGCVIVLSVLQVSFLQLLCPDGLLGRLNATLSFFTWSAISLGSLVGGLLASTIGVRATLVVAASGVLLAATWVLCSPLRGMRELPT